MQFHLWRRVHSSIADSKNLWENNFQLWGFTIIGLRLVGSFFSYLIHVRAPDDFMPLRLAIEFTATLLVLCVVLLPRIMGRYHPLQLAALHFFTLLPYPIEAMMIGSASRDIWIFFALSHIMLSVLLCHEAKAKIVAIPLHLLFFIGYFLDPSSQGITPMFIALWICLTGFSFVDNYGGKLINQLSTKEQKLRVLAKEYEDSLKMLSHDMANIMALARDNLEMLEEEIAESGIDLPTRPLDCLEDSRFAVNQGINVLAAVRDSMASSAGKKNADEQFFELNEAVKEVIHLWSRSALRKDLKVVFESNVSPSHSFVKGFRSIFSHSVLGNLLSNAIKFSPQGSTIFISLSEESSSHLRLSVTDEGKGMDSEKLVSVFDETGMTSSEGTNGEKGTGFGMPLVKATVNAFGGTIGVSSISSGDSQPPSGIQTGTAFVVRLPRLDPRNAPSQSHDSHDLAS